MMFSPEISVCHEDGDTFVVVNSIRVAFRGRPGTPQAQSWVVIEPGWRVDGLARLTISYQKPSVH